MKYSNYFCIPNTLILDKKLSSSEFSVAAYLYSLYSAYGHDSLLGSCIKVKQSTIAEACRISVDTVARVCSKLMKKGIILGRQRTVREDRTLGTYIYTLLRFSPEEQNYTLISKKAAGMLRPKELKVYSVFCLCRENYKNSFFHSYRDLCDLTGMKKEELISVITGLIQLGLIRKQKRRTHCGDYTENKYFIVVHARGRISRKKRTAAASYLNRCSRLKAFETLLPKTIKTTHCIYDSIWERICQELLKGKTKFFGARGSP